MALMFSHILIPTDGSPLSFVAVEKSLSFARDAEAKVTILAVVEPIPVFSSDASQSLSARLEYERKARVNAAGYLTNAELKARALGVSCEIVQTEDEHPYRAIIAVAEKRGCDLIAMGSHGRGGLAGLILGSETLKVLTHSKIPVLVYR
jgi:nucleotide-binding universal stress UspA family protein